MQNKYECYFGGDFPEIIQNENKSMLVVQNFYGLPFSTFLSLQVKELKMIKLRHFEKIEINEIKEFNPDVVIMMYNPSSFYVEKILNLNKLQNFDFTIY